MTLQSCVMVPMMKLEGSVWTILRYFLLIAVHCETVHCLFTYYMVERCPQSVLRMDDHHISSGRLRLSKENRMYRNDMLCILSIRAPEGHMIMVRFLSMETEGFMSLGCDSDYLILYNGEDDKQPSLGIDDSIEQYTYTPDSNRLCGSLTPRTTFVTTQETITLKFVSDTSLQYRGFDLIFTSFHTGACNDSEYRCTNGRCINETLHCNSFNNCGDDSDWCGPNIILVLFIIFICIFVFLLLLCTIFRCSCKRKTKQIPKSSSSCEDNDLMTPGKIRVASFKGFSRQDSSNSVASSNEPQQEPLLQDTSSV